MLGGEPYGNESAFSRFHGRSIVDLDSGHLHFTMMPEVSSGLLWSDTLAYVEERYHGDMLLIQGTYFVVVFFWVR